MSQIKVDNLFDGETVAHQLLYVRGSFNGIQEKKVSVSCNDEPVEIILRNEHFHFFAELKLGKNVIEFSSHKKTLCIFYQPLACERFVRVLLIVLADQSSDHESDNTLLTKVSLAAKLMQCFIAEEVRAKFGSRKTFRFEFDAKNVCRLFRSKFCQKDFLGLSDEDIYWKFAKEIIQSHDKRGTAKYLAILSCTKYSPSLHPSEAREDSWEDILSRTKFYINYSVGDVAVVHGGGLYSWPISMNEISSKFLDKTIVDEIDLNDSAGRGTVGGVYATTFGTAVHELGHIFNLAHTLSGIMGRGFDNIQLAFLGETYRENIAMQNKCRNNRRNFTYHRDASSCNEEIFYHFADYSLIILNNHRWLNNFTTTDDSLTVNHHKIQSKVGLSVIELRTEDGETVIGWDLNLYKPKMWLIPNEIKQKKKNFSLFIMDIVGGIITFCLD